KLTGAATASMTKRTPEPTAKGTCCTSFSVTIGSSISSRRTSDSSAVGRGALQRSLQPELPAGSVDVGPFPFADRRGDPLLLEDLDECSQPLGGGIVKRQLRHRVHRDQIDVRMPAAQESCQRACL